MCKQLHFTVFVQLCFIIPALICNHFLDEKQDISMALSPVYYSLAHSLTHSMWVGGDYSFDVMFRLHVFLQLAKSQTIMAEKKKQSLPSWSRSHPLPCAIEDYELIGPPQYNGKDNTSDPSTYFSSY